MKKLLLAAALIASSSAGAEWIYKEQRNVMTDVNNDIIVTFSKDNHIAVRCDGSDFEIMINTGDYVGRSLRNGLVRFDKEKAQSVLVNSAVSGAAFFIDKQDKVRMVESMKKYSSVTFLVNDYRGGKSYETFKLTGFTKEASKLECLK